MRGAIVANLGQSSFGTGQLSALGLRVIPGGEPTVQFCDLFVKPALFLRGRLAIGDSGVGLGKLALASIPAT